MQQTNVLVYQNIPRIGTLVVSVRVYLHHQRLGIDLGESEHPFVGPVEVEVRSALAIQGHRKVPRK